MGLREELTPGGSIAGGSYFEEDNGGNGGVGGRGWGGGEEGES